MTEFGGPAPPFGGKVSEVRDDHEYALWDAAYVLGSLSSSERREFEAHLSSCPSCRAAVAELSDMPGLLSRLDDDDVAAIDDGTNGSSATPPLRPELLTSLLEKARWRRRRSRLAIWTLAAAAAVVVLGVVIVLQINRGMPTSAPPQAESAVAMTQVTPSAFTATVSVTSQQGGTTIDMSCTYGEWPPGVHHEEDQDAGEKLAMVVVGRDGRQDRVASWVAVDDTTATPRGHTSIPVEQIAAVQVVSVDTGQLYLQRNL